MKNKKIEYPDVKLMINDEWRDATDNRKIEVINPATNKGLGFVAHAQKADLDDALAAAQSGFKIWRDTPAIERAHILRKAADLLRQRCELIAPILTLEQGKSISEAQAEILNSADIIDWFAGEAQRAYGKTIPSRSPSVHQLTIKKPVGPVAAFTPWNFPISQIVRKLAAALTAGCSIIVKAPEETPAAPAHLIQAFIDAAVPKGVIGLVYGDPAEISNYLISHPTIKKVSFTGSTAVGKQLASLAGQYMKKTTMELGGHAPVVICDDANLEMAAERLAFFKYRNAGQICASPTRILVQAKVFDKFLERFLELSKNINIGDGLDNNTQMGPLANKRRSQALDAFLSDASDKSAKIFSPISLPDGDGNFYSPHIVVSNSNDLRLANEEPFGPITLFQKFHDIEDVIEEANRLPYGLASYAFTSSASTAHTLATNIEAGMTAINSFAVALPEIPFEGVGDSGYGSEGGFNALESYTISKLISHTFI